MNWDIIEGKWDKFKAQVQAKYADITDDELMQAKAEGKELSALMQEKYGYAKDEAEEKVAELEAEMNKVDA